MKPSNADVTPSVRVFAPFYVEKTIFRVCAN